MTTLTLAGTAAATTKADALVVGVVSAAPSGRGGQTLRLTGGLADAPAARDLVKALAAVGATGKAGEVVKVPAAGLGAPVVVAAGLGDAPARGTSFDLEVLRRAAGAAVRSLAGTGKVALALPADDAGTAGAVAEGALFGAYSYLRYRTSSRKPGQDPVETLVLLSEAAKDKAVKAAVDRARALAEAVARTRDWVNTPPADLPPAVLAQEAAETAKARGLEVTVLDEKALTKGGYGGLIGVGKGSSRPPRLVRIAYRHPKATTTIAFVGKGITFDSGGLSLKPGASMETMKSDMSGAAAVVAAVAAVADLGLPVNVTAWAPLAENMPSGTAQRPSDVLTIYGGKTVEVLNTDAEGRLVLADALVAACAEEPSVVVDVATLTGAQLVALGSRTSAIMANDDALRTRLHELATEAGEQMWPMPLPAELRPSLDSQVADIANMGDRYGGMLVAGLFLQDFVADGVRWAHLDIAGPAFNEGEPYGYTPKGGTGAAVRTLVCLAEAVAAGTV
ncbi:MAG TPA: leucyl aminopeptidase [Motilibacteraceae bacterium]|nr:leucyl aminopeptidase [Motilibacteraceae bacterium]